MAQGVTIKGKTPTGLNLEVAVDSNGYLIISNPGGGGGTGLTDTQLRATPVPVSGTVAVSNPTTNPETGLAKLANQLPDGHAVAEATKNNLLPYAQLLTASGTITPAAGKRIQLVWCQIVPSSDNANANLVTIGFASGATLYRVYALGRSAVFTGAVDQVLNITLATSEPVTVNIQYREVT